MKKVKIYLKPQRRIFISLHEARMQYMQLNLTFLNISISCYVSLGLHYSSVVMVAFDSAAAAVIMCYCFCFYHSFIILFLSYCSGPRPNKANGGKIVCEIREQRCPFACFHGSTSAKQHKKWLELPRRQFQSLLVSFCSGGRKQKSKTTVEFHRRFWRHFASICVIMV